MDNADIVRSAILAQNRGDDETLMAVIDPAVEWHVGAGGLTGATIVRGRDALMRMVAQARSQAGAFRITLHEVREAGDEVLVIGSVSASLAPRR